MRQIPPFGLRMPDDLKDQIKQAAAQEGRSMNAQIVQHLRAIYQPTERQEAAA
ncbi:Arc family DNA-binding protein [Ruixingdingia sedimenti]|uniref:Arc family DNA-binding protein n=1 Tax=Ruixingdingia sedimenti TaxID=3073604 RepID=A0ABU1F2A6_9RHOB|nr:Arc family DNA-binding protein [Xinfangfangia sp. LG-4]MDR5650988.1 Arc family DNA-binding protein [Xinfangfangia sp. LG-4]